MTAESRHALVSGRVQGVAYRWSTQERARELQLGGWVRNLSDGRVEVWYEGEGDSVERLTEWLHAGPASARVSGVVVQRVEPRGCDAFDVRPDGGAPGVSR